MARSYRPTFVGRLRDRTMTFMLTKGVGPPGICLLTVPGRKTGIPRTTPVAPLENDDGRWLVAPYGPDGWARNARAAGKVTLHRGRTSESLAVTELRAVEAAPILRRYLAEHPRTVGAYFDVDKDASLEDFAAEAAPASGLPAPGFVTLRRGRGFRRCGRRRNSRVRSTGEAARMTASATSRSASAQIAFRRADPSRGRRPLSSRTAASPDRR
jgi:deazaflavin-dependent oxidoreductase (nitroreductase family)